MRRIRRIQRYKHLILHTPGKELHIDITAMPVDEKKAVLTSMSCLLPRISIKYGSESEVSQFVISLTSCGGSKEAYLLFWVIFSNSAVLNVA